MNPYVNTITHGDCCSLIKNLPDSCLKAVICSPPYFNQREYTDDPAEIGREYDMNDYLEKLLGVFQDCFRVISEDGSVIFNLGDKYIDGNLSLIPYRFAALATERNEKARLINNITWVKTNPTPRQFSRRLVSSTEPFFHFVKSDKYHYDLSFDSTPRAKKQSSNSKIGAAYYKKIEESSLTTQEKEAAVTELDNVVKEVKDGALFSFRMKIRGVHSLAFGGQEGGRNTQILTKRFSIIRVPGNKMHKDVFECSVETIRGSQHPAIYPTEIIEFFIKLTTQKNDIILDPFMGSGTTAVCCKKLGRRFIGFELSKNFIEIAEKRLSNVHVDPECHEER